MGKQRWDEVDAYFASLRDADDALSAAIERSSRAGLPDIAVSPEQGRLLTVLARSVGARKILEIGTLGGYSAICLARALPADGVLVTLEYDARHAAVARENLEAAGLDDRVEVVEGSALDTLPKLLDTHPDGFDFIFIDADKENYAAYLEWALRLAHVGTLVVADNVVREGEVANSSTSDTMARGVRRYLELISRDDRVIDASVQTVGSKGYDGLSFAVVIAATESAG